MADCKIIHLCYGNAIKQAERQVRFESGTGMAVCDHPAAEREINSYLAQGYRIVNAFQSDGMWFILQKQQ